MASLEVRIRVSIDFRVGKLLRSDYGQGKFVVIVRDRVTLVSVLGL